MQSLTLEGGFAKPVFGAQETFRALMDAFANPGQTQPIDAGLDAPGLAPELAAVALTMCDHDTLLWLDPALREDAGVVAWLRFHTGAPLTEDPAQAMFALVSKVELLPEMARFALGTDQYPDRSTTIALALPSLKSGADLTLRGPGIKDHAHIAPGGLPDGFVEQWGGNRELFPRGIDLLLCGEGHVVGLPRTTRITMEAH